MKFGYVRCSTDKQSTNRQIDMLKPLVDEIIEDKVTGTTTKRDGLQLLLSKVRAGDIVYVESISRLSRRTVDVLTLIEELTEKQVDFISLKEQFDTTTPMGKAMLGIFAVMAQMERDVLAQRVKEGMEASKRRGTKMGRPKLPKDKLNVALRIYDSNEYSIKEIVETTGVSQGSLYRAINKRKLES